MPDCKNRFPLRLRCRKCKLVQLFSSPPGPRGWITPVRRAARPPQSPVARRPRSGSILPSGRAGRSVRLALPPSPGPWVAMRSPRQRCFGAPAFWRRDRWLPTFHASKNAGGPLRSLAPDALSHHAEAARRRAGHGGIKPQTLAGHFALELLEGAAQPHRAIRRSGDGEAVAGVLRRGLGPEVRPGNGRVGGGENESRSSCHGNDRRLHRRQPIRCPPLWKDNPRWFSGANRLGRKRPQPRRSRR